MRKYILFLRCSSVAIKVVAWIILFLGIFGAVSILAGAVKDAPRWLGIVNLVSYVFFFWVLFLIAKISDILITIITAAPKD